METKDDRGRCGYDEDVAAVPSTRPASQSSTSRNSSGHLFLPLGQPRRLDTARLLFGYAPPPMFPASGMDRPAAASDPIDGPDPSKYPDVL
jgi:hypothetical protein